MTSGEGDRRMGQGVTGERFQRSEHGREAQRRLSMLGRTEERGMGEGEGREMGEVEGGLVQASALHFRVVLKDVSL